MWASPGTSTVPNLPGTCEATWISFLLLRLLDERILLLRLVACELALPGLVCEQLLQRRVVVYEPILLLVDVQPRLRLVGERLVLPLPSFSAILLLFVSFLLAFW